MADEERKEERRTIPPDLPENPNPPPPGQEDDAILEFNQLGTGRPIRDLEREAKERDHQRGERFRDNFERLAIWGMNGIFGAMAVLGIVWLVHMIFPEKCSASVSINGMQLCRWLIPEQVIILQDVLTGGLVAGLIGDHIKRRMAN